jgi:hypothetical protein
MLVDDSGKIIEACKGFEISKVSKLSRFSEFRWGIRGVRLS